MVTSQWFAGAPLASGRFLYFLAQPFGLPNANNNPKLYDYNEEISHAQAFQLFCILDISSEGISWHFNLSFLSVCAQFLASSE